MADFDIIVRGGTIVDGSGAAAFQGDVGIRNGRICEVGQINGSSDEVVDASGLIVAPGVIDLHTHYDAQIFWDPYCTNSGWHGVTSVVVGNCGFGFAPCHAADRDRYMLMMENTEQVPLGAMRKALPWNWESYPDWAQQVEKLRKGVNIGSFMPMNSLMIYVMGIDAAKSRPATENERAEMRRLLHEAMDNGALGFGFSHLQESNSHKDIDGSPMVTDAMHFDEVMNLATVLRDRGEGVIQALVEVPVLPAVHRKNLERLAELSGRPIIHTVIMQSAENPHYHEDILAWLDDVQSRGLPIYSQALTFRFVPLGIVVKNFDAWQQHPIWAEFQHAGDIDARVAKALDADYRDRLRVSAEGEARVRRFTLVDAAGASRFAKYQGQTLIDIAEQMARPMTDIFLDLCAESRLECEVSQEQENIDPEASMRILMHPRVIPGTSDGGAHVKFWSGGQFGTDLICWLVKEQRLATLEQIHNKLSRQPADAMGWRDRGSIAPGQAADIMIYDFDDIGYPSQYQKVWDLPDGDWRRITPAKGIRRIIVNGRTTFIDGIETGATPGHFIKASDLKAAA